MSWVAVGVALASAAVSQYNTQQVAKKQDNAAADSIRQQSMMQKRADEKVNNQVNELEASSSGDERSKRLSEYMDALRLGRPGMQAGLITNIGSSAFQGDSAQAANDVQMGAAGDAGLMARIDAPALQRQGEAFGYGNLATDINLIGRQSRGQTFMDELRMKGIKRNPWLDAAAAAGTAYAGSKAGGGGGGEPQTMFGPGVI